MFSARYILRMTVLFADRGQAAKVEQLPGGLGIRVTGRLSRTGVQVYAPWPGAKIQNRPIKVYRPPGEVFKADSLRTLKGIPVTVGHPREKKVDATTWKRYAVGHVEAEHVVQTQDGAEDYVETSLIVSDAKTIKEVDNINLTEISQGYFTELDWTAGVTDSGEHYDAVQTQIVHNHTALLLEGQARAGKGARILMDSAHITGKKKMDEEEKKAFKAEILGGLSSMLDERDKAKADAAKLEADRAKLEADKAEFEAEKAKIEADKKAEAGKQAADAGASNDSGELTPEQKGAEAAKKALALTDAAEAVVRTKAEAAAMLPQDFAFDGLTAREIQEAALKRHLPGFAFSADTSDGEIAGAFGAVKQSGAKYVADSSADVGVLKPSTILENYNKRMAQGFADSYGETK